jgi:hypothetical protein
MDAPSTTIGMRTCFTWDLDGDQRLDHVLVHAPGGLDAAAQEALRRLRRTYMKGGAGELQVAVSAVGDADVLRGMASGLGEALATVVGPAGGSAVWDTATPWVPPRNLKRSGKDSLEGMVRAECQRRGLPELVGVEVLGDEAVRSLRHFVLHDETLAPPRHAASPAAAPVRRGRPGADLPGLRRPRGSRAVWGGFGRGVTSGWGWLRRGVL